MTEKLGKLILIKTKFQTFSLFKIQFCSEYSNSLLGQKRKILEQERASIKHKGMSLNDWFLTVLGPQNQLFYSKALKGTLLNMTIVYLEKLMSFVLLHTF